MIQLLIIIVNFVIVVLHLHAEYPVVLQQRLGRFLGHFCLLERFLVYLLNERNRLFNLLQTHKIRVELLLLAYQFLHDLGPLLYFV